LVGVRGGDADAGIGQVVAWWFGGCLVPRNFAKFFRFPVTSNI
jgi:hypothetical protein